MELPELSLAPGLFVVDKSPNSSSSESDSNLTRKRKFFDDQLLKTEQQAVHTSVDLQLKDPLPLDWEQCLDLESGRMYYLNRKTSRKSWNRPKDQKLDLELNMSSTQWPSSHEQYCSNISSETLLEDTKKKYISNSNMMALACMNCHLLVILSKSSPSCPNCKYVHSIPSQQSPAAPKLPVVKSLNTLSLLN
ncbi:protein CURLY FLAG LEAF 1-like [Alnus glutinosa]|uniref:protein CURLY FLAG LEAF 1-like n=1 Tax=Alnus glutinosa TaxID=3517 RepID=UPI002D776D28|nr:protein CURLY FLAG LEAF 1-like [Alnus glutinosa]